MGNARHGHSTEQKLQYLHYHGFLTDKEEAMIQAALKNDHCEVDIDMPDGKNLTVHITLAKKFS